MIEIVNLIHMNPSLSTPTYKRLYMQHKSMCTSPRYTSLKDVETRPIAYWVAVSNTHVTRHKNLEQLDGVSEKTLVFTLKVEARWLNNDVCVN